MTFTKMASQPYVKSMTQNTDAATLCKGTNPTRGQEQSYNEHRHQVTLFNIAPFYHNGMVFRRFWNIITLKMKPVEGFIFWTHPLGQSCLYLKSSVLCLFNFRLLQTTS